MDFLLPTGKKVTKEEFLVMGTKDYRSMIFDIYVKTGLFVEQKDDVQEEPEDQGEVETGVKEFDEQSEHTNTSVLIGLLSRLQQNIVVDTGGDIRRVADIRLSENKKGIIITCEPAE